MTGSVSSSGPQTLRRVDVLDSFMTYVDEGEGPVMLFLHGNPTSSYLWRNVIPHVSAQARCVAPDLIGMGGSGKPDLDYRFADHARYLDAFIAALGLTDITLVLHDWGSALGFHRAHRHPDTIRGLAFMEAITMPLPDWSVLPERLREVFQAFRDPAIGRRLLIDENAFIEQVLPSGIVRALREAEHEEYRRPYRDPADRTPIWRWPNEIPIAGHPADVHDLVAGYAGWLERTPLPKLLLTASPGALITAPVAERLTATLPNLTAVHVGAGVHYLQEDAPDAIGAAIAAWHAGLP